MEEDDRDQHHVCYLTCKLTDDYHDFHDLSHAPSHELIHHFFSSTDQRIDSGIAQIQRQGHSRQHGCCQVANLPVRLGSVRRLKGDAQFRGKNPELGGTRHDGRGGGAGIYSH